MMKRGYTLIELMVVVAIISLLVAVAVPNLLEAETRSRISRTKADFQTLNTALTAYSTDYQGAFPPGPNNPAVTPLWQGPQQFLDNAGFALTTPIKYLVSVPMSVFMPNNTPNSPGAGIFYFNYDYHRKLNAGAPPQDLCPFSDAAVGAGVQYVVWSLGPNKGDPASSDGTVYDPTNGTVSRGRVAFFSDRRQYYNIYDVK